jgi:hypothetical protein
MTVCNLIVGSLFLAFCLLGLLFNLDNVGSAFLHTSLTFLRTTQCHIPVGSLKICFVSKCNKVESFIEGSVLGYTNADDLIELLKDNR